MLFYHPTVVTFLLTVFDVGILQASLDSLLRHSASNVCLRFPNVTLTIALSDLAEITLGQSLGG